MDLFKRWDVDRNGTVERPEFAKALDAAVLKGPKSPGVTKVKALRVEHAARRDE